LRFSWDERKNLTNERKHNVGFAVAARVFIDASIIGTVGPALLAVVYTVRDEDGEVIRLISASMELDAKNPAPPTRKQRAEIAALAELPDADIDYSNIPAKPAGFWADAVRGGLYRPVKRQLTVRIDADVLAWLRSQGTGYHGRLNQILRSAMLKDVRSR